MAKVHPTAVVEGEVELGEGVEIGPFCLVRSTEAGPVRLRAGVRLLGQVTLSGPVEVGERAVLYPGVCVGYPGQDFKFTPGSPTAGVQIGADTVLREHVTVHAATSAQTPTVLGERNYLMVASHVGHDCRLGDRCILVNNAALGGHVTLGSDVNVGGGTVIHQHCRVGRLCMLGGDCAMSNDLPPFLLLHGRNVTSGINVVGLRRAGVSREEITALRRAYREVFEARLPREEMVAALSAQADRFPLMGELAEFIRAGKRGLCFPIIGRREQRTEGVLEPNA